MNKRKLYIYVSYLILIVIMIGVYTVMKNNDELAPFQAYVGSQLHLERSSLVEYGVNSYRVAFITDSHHNAHVFFIGEDESIVSYQVVSKWKQEGEKIDWQISVHNNDVLFTSILFDDAIDRIAVKSKNGEEMQQGLRYITYNNTRFVIAANDRIESNPVDIVAYSKQNQVIFRNIKEK